MKGMLDPWRAAGWIDGTELRVAETLAELYALAEPELALAFALAIRAPRLGHLAVDLREPGELPERSELAESSELPAGSEDAELLAGAPGGVPDLEDAGAWIAALARCDAVLVAGDLLEPSRRPFVLHGSWLYTARYWNYQVRTAERIGGWCRDPAREIADPVTFGRGLDRLFRPPGAGPRSAAGTGPAPIDRQRLAAAMACTRRFTVITGGPGMGKTWTVRNVLALRQVDHLRGGASSPLRVALAAPTGKAAARMREALRADIEGSFRAALVDWLGAGSEAEREVQALVGWLLDLPAHTLHRLLGYRGDNPSRFRHDRRNPLPQDLVIVDESSMVDFALMSKLVDAIGERGQLLLLGDRNQLASVEAGTVLADICGPVRAAAPTLSRGAVARLHMPPALALEGPGVDLRIVEGEHSMHDMVVQFDRTYRFDADSGIGRFAAACLAPSFDLRAARALFDEGQAPDVSLHGPTPEGALPRRVERMIVEGYRAYLEALATLEQRAPQDEDAERAAHLELLAAFDRFRILCAHRRGRLGVEGVNRRVEALLRSEGLVRGGGRFYPGRPVLVLHNDYAVRRFNGDIGVVLRPRHGPHAGQLVAAFPDTAAPGGVSYLATSRLPTHETVYAMTIHKSQGSEYHHVLVVLPAAPSRVCTRELVYTGVTRARARMTMVAHDAVLEAALKRQVRRASGLGPALWGDADGAG